MRISDAFPSKWLKASDLRGNVHQVKIQDVQIEKLQDGTSKPCVYFLGKPKALILNKTNSKKIVEAYGDDTDDWINQVIELYPAEVEFQGDTVEAVRVRIPAKIKANGAVRRSAQAEPAHEEINERNPPPRTVAQDLDDEVPF